MPSKTAKSSNSKKKSSPSPHPWIVASGILRSLVKTSLLLLANTPWALGECTTAKNSMNNVYLLSAAIDNDDPAALAECNRIAGVCFNAADGNGEYYMNDWSHATFLHFHKTDSEGKNHTFADYKVGMFIDLFDQHFTQALQSLKSPPSQRNGDIYTIGVTPVQHEGEASGLARIKVFDMGV